jgi:hypothetical protein
MISNEPLVIGAPPISGGNNETCKQGTDDTNNNVQENALLTIGSHHDAGQPSQDTADNQ